MKKIGEDARLFEPRIKALLPSCYTKIWELTFLTDAELDQAVETGILHPDVPREELRGLREKRPYNVRSTLPLEIFEDAVQQLATEELPSSPPAGVTRPGHVVLGEVRLPPNYSDDQRNQLLVDLQRVVDEHGVRFVAKLTAVERAERAYEKALGNFSRRYDALGRKFTTEIVRRVKKNKLRGSEKLTPQDRAKKWGFEPDETSIDLNDGWDRFLEVLSMIGVEDEFEAMRDRAEMQANAPDLPLELEVRGRRGLITHL